MTPTEDYHEKGARLLAILQSPELIWTQHSERMKLQAELRAAFMEAFGLEPDKGRLAERLFWKFCNTPLAPKRVLFDHESYFRRGENCVIVSQPYGIDVDELKRWATDCAASYTIAEGWSYYAPGLSQLFFVEFTPQAKADFEKRLRRREWTRYKMAAQSNQ